MHAKNKSPEIHSIKWGKVVLGEGQHFKDAKLYPGGAREWDWNETGTHHSPGIQPADVQELLDHGAEVIVLSKGFHSRLQTSRQTEELLERRQIPFYQLQTGDAVEKYNELRQTQPAGALIHSTC